MTNTEIKTFVDTFVHDDTGDVKRPKFRIYGRKGGTDDWTILGYKQEGLAIANNYEEEEIEDVNGNKYSDKSSKDEQLEMSEVRFNPKKTKFLADAVKYVIGGEENSLNDYQLLFICDWLVNGNKHLARKVDNVTLSMDNIGGQNFTTGDITFKSISQGTAGSATYGEDGKPNFVEG